MEGVILNQISPMIYEKVKTEIEDQCGVKVIGYVPKVEDCQIESRHLGLVMPDEIADLREKLQKLAAILEETLDLDLLLRLADGAPELTGAAPKGPGFDFRLEKPVKIAVARDEAFCFFYEDNLQLLRKMGAELIEFSPIHDQVLPADADGLLLPGGYPELYAKALEDNRTMRSSIRKRCLGGLPLLAECGGFMYLHKTMEDTESSAYEAVGLIPGRAYRTSKLGRFGYIHLTPGEGTGGADADNGAFFEDLGRETGPFPAHEFHYFDSTSCGEDFLAKKPVGNRQWRCIHATDTMVAGFPHFYYYGNPALPEAFLRKALKYSERKRT